MNVVERRLELLKLEGFGMPQAEIAKELSQRASCSKRTIYNDFESREDWQPILLSVIKSQDIALKIVNRYEQIYHQASRLLATSNNEYIQIAALNTMIKISTVMYETLVAPEIMSRLKILERKAEQGVFIP